MAFNLKHLFLFVFALSISLSISRFLIAGFAFGSIAFGAILFLPFVAKDFRRNYIYGGLSGTIMVLIVTFLVSNMYADELGLNQGQRGPHQNNFLKFVSYAVSVSFVIGATGGLLLRSRKIKEYQR